MKIHHLSGTVLSKCWNLRWSINCVWKQTGALLLTPGFLQTVLYVWVLSYKKGKWIRKYFWMPPSKGSSVLWLGEVSEGKEYECPWVSDTITVCCSPCALGQPCFLLGRPGLSVLSGTPWVLSVAGTLHVLPEFRAWEVWAGWGWGVMCGLLIGANTGLGSAYGFYVEMEV